jgi:hypothetical protein
VFLSWRGANARELAASLRKKMGVGLFLRRIYPGSLLSGAGIVSTELQRAHVKASGDFGFADAGLMQFPDLGGHAVPPFPGGPQPLAVLSGISQAGTHPLRRISLSNSTYCSSPQYAIMQSQGCRNGGLAGVW